MATQMLMYGRKYQRGVNWITAIAMASFHIGAVASLFYVDVGAILTAVILWIVAGSLGIGMGYHRLLTHRGYKTYRWLEYFLTWCGTLALEGGPIFWVATHRVHHQKSDQEGDPHTPREGGWWAHAGVDSAGRRPAPGLIGTETLRPRPGARPRPRVALDLALDHEHRRRPRAPRVRRHPVRTLGNLLPDHVGAALDVAGQLRYASLGDRADSRPAMIRRITGGWRS